MILCSIVYLIEQFVKMYLIRDQTVDFYLNSYFRKFKRKSKVLLKKNYFTYQISLNLE